MEKSSFQFKDPYLTKFAFEINKNFKGEKNLSIQNKMQIAVKKKDDEPIAIVSLNLIIGDHNDSVPFFIDCVMESQFTWNNDAYDEATINELLSINAPSLLLGYLRPIVSQITNLSPYSPYNIPFYNFLSENEN